MTTPNDTPSTDAEAPAETPHADTARPAADTTQEQAVEESVDEHDRDTANAEAAKYRRRLRDTEAQLTTTTDRLTAYQRRHVEQLAADLLATPADLFDVGQLELTQFLNDDGDIDTDEVLLAATALVDLRPQLGKNYTPPWPATTDYGQGVRTQSVDGGPTWAKALAPDRRG